MNILNLLTKKKYFTGVEISDLNIRIAYFRPKKKVTKQILKSITETLENELILVEESIPENIIANGAIVDKELFRKIIKDIWKREKLYGSYAVVSIPEDKIYSHIFPFPKTVSDIHLKEAIDLAIDFQLPFKRDTVYIGWEDTDGAGETNKILVSTIPKNIADDYIKTLEEAGVNTFALESHIASIARSVKLQPGELSLLTKKNQSSVTIFTVKDNILQFSRTLPALFIKEENFLKDETNKIKNSLESELKETIHEVSFTETTIRDKFLKYLENISNLEPQSKWLIPVGAVVRGEISQGQDNQISLLPVGIAETYKYHNIKTFTKLTRNLLIVVSLFFLFTFIAAYLYIFSVSQIIQNESSILSTFPVTSDIIQKESLIKKVNSLTLVSQSILSNTPNWSILIDEINSRVIPGITMSSFGAPSLSDMMFVTGTAKSRDILNQFKKSFQASTYFTEIDLPITNLEQKADIPFSISFHLKDPSMLYYK